MTFDWKANDERMQRYVSKKMEAIAEAMAPDMVGPSTLRLAPFDTRIYQSTHITGGTIVGADPHSSVVSPRLQHWDAQTCSSSARRCLRTTRAITPRGHWRRWPCAWAMTWSTMYRGRACSANFFPPLRKDCVMHKHFVRITGLALAALSLNSAQAQNVGTAERKQARARVKAEAAEAVKTDRTTLSESQDLMKGK